MSVKLPTSAVEVHVDFDPAEMKKRYAAERERRLRPDTVKQFKGLSDVVEIDSSDPYTARTEREALIADIDVAVLGGGFGGLLAGAHLTRDGVTDFRIVEQGGDFGGTWYWNRYPGVQCDVESYIYMPLLEETGYIPTKRYADGAEIYEHARRIGRHFDLYRAALFHTTITHTRWMEDRKRWEVRTDRGDVLHAKFVLRANGPLSKPQVPQVPGMAKFGGKIFHTSRWDYGYTGGSAAGDMQGLRDKRVAIVGTGATGVQAVPYLAQDAKELFVVQRTPSVVGPRDNRPTDSDWAAALQPGWQADRQHNFNSCVNGHPCEENLVGDVWTTLLPGLNGQHLVDFPVDTLSAEDQLALAELADLAVMRGVHQRVDDIVDDPATAAALKPWFGAICKRPCFNDEYLQAFNRPSVHLVAAPEGIEAVTETGIVVDGTQYEVDCLIFATGFEVGSTNTELHGYDVVGCEGLSMRQHFADGAKTLHGFLSHQYPNFVEVGLSQNAFLVNFTFMLDRKARHAARLVRHALTHDIDTIEPNPDAQQDWIRTIREGNEPRLAYLAACTPGYYSGQGQLKRGFWTDIYNGSEVEFWDLIEEWWDAGEFKGLRLESSALNSK